jgi:hypothetical protein
MLDPLRNWFGLTGSECTAVTGRNKRAKHTIALKVCLWCLLIFLGLMAIPVANVLSHG